MKPRLSYSHFLSACLWAAFKHMKGSKLRSSFHSICTVYELRGIDCDWPTKKPSGGIISRVVRDQRAQKKT